MSDIDEKTQLCALVLAQQSELSALQQYFPLIDHYKARAIGVEFDESKLVFYEEGWTIFRFESTSVWHGWDSPYLLFDRCCLSIFENGSIKITLVQGLNERNIYIVTTKRMMAIYTFHWDSKLWGDKRHSRPLLACEVDRIRDGLLRAAARWGWVVRRE